MFLFGPDCILTGSEQHHENNLSRRETTLFERTRVICLVKIEQTELRGKCTRVPKRNATNHFSVKFPFV